MLGIGSLKPHARFFGLTWLAAAVLLVVRWPCFSNTPGRDPSTPGFSAEEALLSGASAFISPLKRMSTTAGRMLHPRSILGALLLFSTCPLPTRTFPSSILAASRWGVWCLQRAMLGGGRGLGAPWRAGAGRGIAACSVGWSWKPTVPTQPKPFPPDGAVAVPVLPSRETPNPAGMHPPGPQEGPRSVSSLKCPASAPADLVFAPGV